MILMGFPVKGWTAGILYRNIVGDLGTKGGPPLLCRMDRTDVAILVNSTPAYYYILPLFFTMLRRYAPDLEWPVYLATEELEH